MILLLVSVVTCNIMGAKINLAVQHGCAAKCCKTISSERIRDICTSACTYDTSVTRYADYICMVRHVDVVRMVRDIWDTQCCEPAADMTGRQRTVRSQELTLMTVQRECQELRICCTVWLNTRGLNETSTSVMPRDMPTATTLLYWH